MAYLPSLRKYSSKPTELNHVADLKIDGHSQIHKKYTGQPSVAIFGDSFLPGLQSNLIIKNISTFNIHHYKVKNPFVLSLNPEIACSHEKSLVSNLSFILSVSNDNF